MKIAVIPDCQVKPGVPIDHLSWCGQYIAAKQPDVVVCIGDFADMESLCSYDKGKKEFEGRRYRKDIDSAWHGMHALLTPIARVYSPRLLLTLGNHEERADRVASANPEFDGLISSADLKYDAFGWEVVPFLKPVVVGGVAFSHYFPSGQLGKPVTSARALLTKMHMSCFAGHQQGRDIAYGRRADGVDMTAIIAGSFYLHDESYLSPLTNRHWRGIYFLHDVRDGAFDEMAVSLEYLKRRFKP